MKKTVKLKAITLFDIMIFVIILLLSLIFFVYDQKKDAASNEKTMNVTVNVSGNAGIIYPEVLKQGEAYLNSVNRPVEIIEVSRNTDTAGNLSSIDIKVCGKGTIDGSKYVFNGQRILVGQKAEIHGGFFAQGVVKRITYENE
ncbi:TPA: hypothetical protein DDW69_00895 [candidate division CPR2 bacterium]|uniref:DUF4330 domain-containing protein n=1 Tax=candidate division CPR2 bacterium GW2011_GWC1_41_48 TaxID=1618344 RepID=A0A0G0W9E5_UNCC2|nr:MAG: hypothetical protein UT47_C0001G0009 [candidate division CPR2 bacterium GW2011_GWC2_39_35]KKR27841.1 MAG: hypothetical protein UT59_C0042G0005 [candidate division CPR2 bacterium GW2011_GWD1_39_7]KKR28739.1 MAG: hypothetical protein UT60_C0013G0006 [candidate division CPR2 bacterium GW2011_GWD2_39_7]KKS09604.1 MAG: hypothetical protein UU65_C0001G0009 [candidate division CPR2 bacterium GW2011_GWC1_41_48]OGB59966.1 MAG: hypothetical protein A2Y27_00265 [candidate division CPR2 bacterium G